jgi:hypothetical protein
LSPAAVADDQGDTDDDNPHPGQDTRRYRLAQQQPGLRQHDPENIFRLNQNI